MPGTKINPVKPNLGLRSDQFNYVQMILLAAVVGMLAALGNLGFRALIHWSQAGFLYLGLWMCCKFRAAAFFAFRFRSCLATGAVGMLLLDRVFRGDVLGYGFPYFLEQVNLGNARIKRGWIFVKAAGAAHLARLGMVGRARRSHRAGRRRDRIGRRATSKARTRTREGAGRGGRGRRHRDHLQRSDGRADVRAGDRPARPHRAGEPYAAHRGDAHRGGDLAHGDGKRRGVPGSASSS